MPKDKRREILRECHDDFTAGHQGEAKTYHRVNERYYWPRMRTDIKSYVGKCKICQSCKVASTKPLGFLGKRHLPTQPFEIVATDLIGPLPRSIKGNRYTCLVTDVFSKYVVVKPIRDAKSKTVAAVIENEVFLTYGVPSKIICDNGPEYRGSHFKTLAEEYNVQILYNARRHPQANPAERYNRSVITMLRAYLKEDQRKWDILLPKIAVALRTAVNQTTGFAPSSLVFLFGFNLKPNHVSTSETPDTSRVYPLKVAEEKKSGVEELVHRVQKAMTDAFGKNKTHYDLRRRHLEFEAGDWVWKKNYVQSSAADHITEKLCKKFVGPFKIVRKISPIVYQLCNEEEVDVGVWHVRDRKSVV